MHEPSNAEIYEKLGRIEAKFDIRLKDILEQVQKTNGRVTVLEKFKDKAETIAEYKKEEFTNGHQEITIDWQKILLYALGLLATALAIIGALASR